MNVAPMLIAVLAIGLLILVHELGHFLAARVFGMKVESFSIGFGPALLSVQGRKTEYRLSLLPLGGYVRIAGMAPGDGTAEDDPGSFANRPRWQRFLVILAGPFVNWLFAFLLLSGLLMAGFQEASPDPIVGRVVDGSVAAANGVQSGDRILEIDGEPIETWPQMTAAIRKHKGRRMPMTIDRGGVQRPLAPTIGEDGMLGIAPSTRTVRYDFPEALGVAVVHTGKVIERTLVSLAQLVRGSREAQLSGPVGIVSETMEAAKTSASALLAFVVMISLALALMNLLPLPALDGGRLLFLAIAMIRRKPVDARIEAIVHAIGLLLLLGLLLFATIGDIGRLVGRRSPPTPPAPAGAPSGDAGVAP